MRVTRARFCVAVGMLLFISVLRAQQPPPAPVSLPQLQLEVLDFGKTAKNPRAPGTENAYASNALIATDTEDLDGNLYSTTVKGGVLDQGTIFKVAPENWNRADPVPAIYVFDETDRKSTRLNSSHIPLSRMPSS